ncbi:hypothetical protein [Bacillus spizizenii]|nr:hypothetical protein [Bacillus spizizenii]
MGDIVFVIINIFILAIIVSVIFAFIKSSNKTRAKLEKIEEKLNDISNKR